MIVFTYKGLIVRRIQVTGLIYVIFDLESLSTCLCPLLQNCWVIFGVVALTLNMSETATARVETYQKWHRLLSSSAQEKSKRTSSQHESQSGTVPFEKKASVLNARTLEFGKYICFEMC